jgi:endo-1,4-beta-xylanase
MDQPALKEVFRNDFHIGAALSVEQICGKDPKAMDLVARQFNTITPEI